MAEERPKPSVDQLVDLLVYAPIGLIYEYPDVMDRLVKRGRSQAQLAKLMAQMAARQGTSGAQHGVEAATADVARAMARLITEVGVKVGLAPDVVPEAAPEPPAPPAPASVAASPAEAAVIDDDPADRLPIAGYEELKARDIVALLGELDAEELVRVRSYEGENRNRKTVLTKISTLLGDS